MCLLIDKIWSISHLKNKNTYLKTEKITYFKFTLIFTKFDV